MENKNKNRFRLKGGTLKSNFIHQDDVNIFLTGKVFEELRETNIEIYNHLTQLNEGPAIFEAYELGRIKLTGINIPLNYFYNLYDQLEIIGSYRSQPTKIIEHLRSLKIDFGPRYFLMLHLIQFKKFPISDPLDIDENLVGDELRICHEFLMQEFQTLDRGNFAKSKYCFEEVLLALNALEDPRDKISLLLKAINYCQATMIEKNPKFSKDNCEEFIQKCELKISHIKRQMAEGLYDEVLKKKVESLSIPSHSNTINKEESNKAPIPNDLLNYSWTKQEVEDYFMQLAYNGFYNKQEIMNFLKANFVGFKELGEVINKVILAKKTGLRQTDLNYLVHKFWVKNISKGGKQDVWVQLLLDNFAYYEKSKFKNVYSALARRKPDNYPFSNIH